MAESYQSPSLTGLLTSMKSLYGILKGISWRFLFLLLCLSVFYAPSGRQIAPAWLSQMGSSVKLFPKGSMSTHTHICKSTRTHTVNPKSKHYFQLVSWIPIVKFVSLAPDTHHPALSNPGDDRRLFLLTPFCSRELCLGLCVCLPNFKSLF